MMKDKTLLCIKNLNEVAYFKKLGISNFLFPLKDYSVGYDTFSLDDLKKLDVNVYIWVNRILTDEDLEAFNELEIPKNVKGFIIEDIGLYEILKGKNYYLVCYQNHLNNNYKTVNYWLKYFDSLVISTDITEEEIMKIIENADKPLVLNTFGYPMVMYSRRKLVSNFYRHLGIDAKLKMDIKEKISNKSFFLRENEYGTAIFASNPFDYRTLAKKIDSKVSFYLINASNLSENDVVDIIEGKEIKFANRGFLDKKTIYKVSDIK